MVFSSLPFRPQGGPSFQISRSMSVPVGRRYVLLLSHTSGASLVPLTLFPSAGHPRVRRTADGRAPAPVLAQTNSPALLGDLAQWREAVAGLLLSLGTTLLTWGLLRDLL